MINIMAYDMYGAWDPVTGHNAPLHKGIGDVGLAADLFTVDMALKYWIGQGIVELHDNILCQLNVVFSRSS